jgi:hypothetical protein
MKKILLFASAFLLLFSCSPSHYVVPLNKKESAVSFNLGGPLISYSGMVIPVPFSSLTYGYGLKKNTTVFGVVHATSMAYGVIQTELGLTHQLKYWDTKKIGFTISPNINFMVDKWEWNYKIYPQLDANFYWYFKGEPHQRCDCRGQRKSSMYLYAGISNWFELSTKRYAGVSQPSNLILIPQLGINLGTDYWKYNFEVKYMGLGTPNNNTVVTYVNPISDNGAIGVYFTVSKIIAAKK